MDAVITLGPTQEPIDDVRFITNASSGRMGAALVEEGLRRGHRITVVCGPVYIRLPLKARTFRVRTAVEMTDTTLGLLAGKDLLISAAAIADYTPEKKISGKIRSGGRLTLRLKPTRKLVREAREMFPELFIVGFKAEHGAGRKGLVDSARKTLEQAKLDLIVANDLARDIVNSDETEAFIVDGKKTERISRMGKNDAAKMI